MKISEDLHRRNPDSAQAAQDLSVSQEKLGNFHLQRGHAGDAEATYATLGKRPNCGQCLGEAGKIIEQERALSACEKVAI